MGKEVQVVVEINGSTAEVKVLLESTELILRGALRRRIPREQLRDPRVEGDALVFEAGDHSLRLQLGAPLAVKWLRALQTPPPSLADKLGLKPGTVLRVLGTCDDLALRDAVTPYQGAEITGEPDLLIAEVRDAESLDSALALEARHPGLPIWMIYAKGPSAFGDAAIRAALRPKGFIDSKSCAVSARLTATRYRRR